jgi:hypothetical protein
MPRLMDIPIHEDLMREEAHMLVSVAGGQGGSVLAPNVPWPWHRYVIGGMPTAASLTVEAVHAQWQRSEQVSLLSRSGRPPAP